MAGQLRTDPALAAPDVFYEKLIALHDGLDADESRRADAALVLVLANHIADASILEEAIAVVRNTLGP